MARGREEKQARRGEVKREEREGENERRRGRKERGLQVPRGEQKREKV